MKSSDALNKYRIEIRSVVAANRAGNPRVFGSVLHGTDGEDSDLDLLIDPTSETTLFDLARIKGTLESLLGVRVDVLTPLALPDHFRSRVQAEAEPV
jgi:predicted nucleotidyltransferase